MQVKEGWEPLCKFLGVPVPDVPFPNVNDTADFNKRINTLLWILSGVVLVGALGLSGIIYGASSFFPDSHLVEASAATGAAGILFFLYLILVNNRVYM